MPRIQQITTVEVRSIENPEACAVAQDLGLAEVEHELCSTSGAGILDVYRMRTPTGVVRVAGTSVYGKHSATTDLAEIRALLAEHGYAIELHSDRIVPLGTEVA